MIEKEEFSKGFDSIQQLKDSIGIIRPFQIVNAHNSRDILLPIDIELGLKSIEPLKIMLREGWVKVKLNIFERMRLDFVIIRKTIYFGSIKIDEDVVI